MKDPVVRTHTLTMRTSRLVVRVVFAALLSALPFHAALANSNKPAPSPAQNLGTAGSFAVLAGLAVTCTDSVVTGDVGVDLGGAITQTNCTITGMVHPGDLVAQKAYDDFLAAYTALAPRTPPPREQWPCTQTFPASTTTLGDTVFAPGVYCFPAALTVTNATFTLNGSSTDTWIFKIGTLGTGALTGTGFTVEMPGGETCSNNVFWWTAEAATLTDSVFIGSILAGTSITVKGGSLDGQALAKAEVTLTDTDVSVCVGGPPGPPGPPHCKIKVTGGGQIQVPDPNSKGRATFGFSAIEDKSGDGVKGQLNYVNHVTGLHVEGPVTDLEVIATNPDGSPKTIQFSGTCHHGPACSFIVTVEDHGEPGRKDQFGITVTGGLTEATSQRVISRGNIQFHDTCGHQGHKSCGGH